MDAERSVTPLRSRLLIAALSAGALAVGSLSVAAASSATSKGATGDRQLMSVGATLGASKTAPIPIDPPPGATDVVTALGTGPGCDDGLACMWHQNSYEGEKQFAQGWMDSYEWLHYEGYTFNSTKNRFGNRAFWVAAPNGQILSCLDPNESRPNLNPAAKHFNVGGIGSTCAGGNPV